MDDRVLALCELSNDLLFHKIPQERLSYYVDASLEAGSRAAQAFAGRNIQDLYRENHISIHMAGSGKGGYGIILRGQASMGKDGCSVEVYEDSIEELAKYSLWNEKRLTKEDGLAVHLAHEFFHFWEYQQNISIADQLEPVVTLSIFGLHRKAHLNRCAEIAAHAFAKTLLNLPVLPNLYDYLYLISTDKMTQANFDGFLERMEALLQSDITTPTQEERNGHV